MGLMSVSPFRKGAYSIGSNSTLVLMTLKDLRATHFALDLGSMLMRMERTFPG